MTTKDDFDAVSNALAIAISSLAAATKNRETIETFRNLLDDVLESEGVPEAALDLLYRMRTHSSHVLQDLESEGTSH